VVVVSTPQAVLADAKKGVSMFLSEHQCSCFRIIENMALRQKSYLTISITCFWQRRSKNLAEDLGVPFLEEYLLYNPYAKLEIGRPAAMQTASAVENILMKLLVMLYKKR
jgi:Mrp family chromosome partitioning ATPase